MIPIPGHTNRWQEFEPIFVYFGKEGGPTVPVPLVIDVADITVIIEVDQ